MGPRGPQAAERAQGTQQAGQEGSHVPPAPPRSPGQEAGHTPVRGALEGRAPGLYFRPLGFKPGKCGRSAGYRKAPRHGKVSREGPGRGPPAGQTAGALGSATCRERPGERSRWARPPRSRRPGRSLGSTQTAGLLRFCCFFFLVLCAAH